LIHLVNAPALFGLPRTAPIRGVKYDPVAGLQRRDRVRFGNSTTTRSGFDAGAPHSAMPAAVSNDASDGEAAYRSMIARYLLSPGAIYTRSNKYPRSRKSCVLR